MSKLFFPLFLLLVLIVTAATLITITQLPAYLFTETDNEYDDRSTRGVFFLIEQELLEQPISHWSKTIDQLALQFAYPLRLFKLGDPIFDQKDQDILNNNQLLKKVIDGAGIYFRRVQNSHNVIALSFNDSNMEEQHRDIQGPYYLILKQLKPLPVEQWPDKLQTLSQIFDFPIQRQALSSRNFSIKQLEWLRAGKILAIDENSNNETYIKWIDDTDQILAAGPLRIPHNQPAFLLGIGLLAISILAIALLCWAYPLWRDIRALTTLTSSLGQGSMKARLQLPRRSALYDLSQQFNAMAKRIQQLVKGHRELTNAVSHEIRTPIARMRFSLEMLEQSDTPKQNQHYLSGLYEDIDELESLVGELLTYARFERNAPMGQQESILLLPWLNELLRQAQAYAGGKTLKLDTEQCPPQQTLMCCPREIARVLHNLLRNGCCYALQEVRITVIIDGTISLLVEDDGPGIPLADRERIFEPFTRLEDSRNRATGGYGLGLAIAKRIVDAHKGSLFVQDSSLGGACFQVSFGA